MIHDITVGTSEPQYIGLRDNGAAIANAHSFTPTVVFYRKGSDEAVTPALTVAWDGTEAESKVKVTGCEALPVGHYHVRYKLTDAQDKVGWLPHDDADLWRVRAINDRSSRA